MPSNGDANRLIMPRHSHLSMISFHRSGIITSAFIKNNWKKANSLSLILNSIQADMPVPVNTKNNRIIIYNLYYPAIEMADSNLMNC